MNQEILTPCHRMSLMRTELDFNILEATKWVRSRLFLKIYFHA